MKARHLAFSKYTTLLGVAFSSCMVMLGACRTLSPESPATLKQSGEGAEAILTLEHDRAQNLYLQMLTVEVNQGIKVPKDQLHTSRGLVQCQGSEVAKICLLRVRLTGDALSATQPLAPEFNENIMSFFKNARSETTAEKLTTADVVCDYVGKNSPPYSVESVSCKIMYPRLMNEVVFLDREAEELAETLRGPRSFGNQKITLQGMLACSFPKESDRTPCVVRVVIDGVLQEKIEELSARSSQPVARQMLRALIDQNTINMPADSVKASETSPTEILGRLTCSIDSFTINSDGRRRYMCRVAL